MLRDKQQEVDVYLNTVYAALHLVDISLGHREPLRTVSASMLRPMYHIVDVVPFTFLQHSHLANRLYAASAIS